MVPLVYNKKSTNGLRNTTPGLLCVALHDKVADTVYNSLDLPNLLLR